MTHSQRVNSCEAREFSNMQRRDRSREINPCPAVPNRPKDTGTLPQPSQNTAQSNSEPTVGKSSWNSLFYFTTRKHLFVAVCSFSLAIIVGAVTPVQSYLLGRAFGTLTDFAAGVTPEHELRSDILSYTILFTGLGTTSWMFTALSFASWALFGQLQARSARERVFKALVYREMEWFDQRRDGAGAMTTKVQSFIADLQNATSQPLGLVLRDLTSALGSLGLALHQSWRLTLVTIATLPLVPIFVPLISRRIQAAMDKQIEVMSTAAKHITHSFSAIETVKCYNGEAVENWRYAALLKLGERYYSRQVNWSALQIAIFRVIALSMFVQGFWYGSKLVEDDAEANSPASLLTAFWSCIGATSALMQMIPILVSLEKGKTAGHRLRLLMVATSPELNQTREDKRKSSTSAGDIVFDNVHFVYPNYPQRLILRGISLVFPAGELVFVIGESGSGKSTIGQLLTRLYQPSGGTITFDNISVEAIDKHWLRSNVLLVEQSSILFNTTLYKNIALGSNDLSLICSTDVKAAAKFSLIYDAIENMPHQFQTRVGMRGWNLSGGQRQRVALARARIRNPPVLILDESTSALDRVSRMVVMDRIRKWCRGRSTIIITHDISQIRPQDYVYVMKDGLVSRSGCRVDIEKTGTSPFREFAQTPNKLCPKRLAEYSDMILPALPEDAVLDSDESEAGVEMSGVEIFPATPWFKGYSKPSVGNSNGTSGQNKTLEMHTCLSSQKRQSMVSTSIERASWQSIPGHLNHISGFDPAGMKSRMSASITTAEGSNCVGNTIGPSLSLVDREFGGGEELRSLKAIIATIWPNLSGWERFVLFIGFVTTLAVAISTPVFAFVFAKLLNTLYDSAGREGKALTYSLGILGIALTDFITIFISFATSQTLAQIWINQLRKKAMCAILEQPREFFDQNENASSKIAESLDQDADEAQQILGRYVGSALKVALIVIISIIWSLLSCWRLTLVLLAIIPLLHLISRAASSVGAAMEYRKHTAIEKASAVFAETFTSIKTIQTMSLESYFERKHSACSNAIVREGIKEGAYVAVYYGLSQSVLHYIIALILWYAALLLEQKVYSLNAVLQSLTLLLMSMTTALIILASIPQWSVSQGAASRLLHLSRPPKDSNEGTDSFQLRHVGEIALNSLKFSYPSRPQELVLKDVSFRISAGTCVALVGPSGSGKSTIASILLKLYPTTSTMIGARSHEVTLSNRDLHRASARTLRSLISIVSQLPVIFPTTISGNIVYGLRRDDPRNSAANVKTASLGAGIHDFVSSLPDGYDTLIGDGGMGLSGGQVQRIAIARALARQPEVLILDEITSGLDAENAGIIRQTVLKLISERRMPGARILTVVVITHAREMMKICDTIVMLDGGRVVEEGGYDQLIRQNGPFTRLLKGEPNDKSFSNSENVSYLEKL